MEQNDRTTKGALQLFDHWERNQWNVRDSDPERDRAGWQALPDPVRGQLRSNMLESFIAEIVVTQKLSPLAYAAPGKEAQIFLCTQLADEARHSVFFHRYLEMVEGGGDSAGTRLGSAWKESSDGQVELFDQRLIALVDRVRREPGDLGAWYEAITLYHLVLEGVLGFGGQRAMLKLARNFEGLPVLTTGLQQLGRDESRHVAFGVHVLRQAVADRFADNVLGVIDDSIDPLVRMIVYPTRAVPLLAHDSGVEYMVYAWETLRRLLYKRLKAIGLVDHAERLDSSWRRAFVAALDSYDKAHDGPHPAREHWLETAAA